MRTERTSSGNLRFYRPGYEGKAQAQQCPLQSIQTNCDDWCPLFNEPEFRQSKTILKLCHITYYFKPGDLVDLRKQEEKDVSDKS